MRDDLRPYWVKKTYLAFRRWYTDYFLRPECAHMGPWDTVMKPWYVVISGPNIRIGRSFTAIGEPMHRVEIGVWERFFKTAHSILSFSFSSSLSIFPSLGVWKRGKGKRERCGRGKGGEERGIGKGVRGSKSPPPHPPLPRKYSPPNLILA